MYPPSAFYAPNLISLCALVYMVYGQICCLKERQPSGFSRFLCVLMCSRLDLCRESRGLAVALIGMS
jgi:hypothetical protein